jgi:hypothetical protein
MAANVSSSSLNGAATTAIQSRRSLLERASHFGCPACRKSSNSTSSDIRTDSFRREGETKVKGLLRRAPTIPTGGLILDALETMKIIPGVGRRLRVVTFLRRSPTCGNVSSRGAAEARRFPFGAGTVSPGTGRVGAAGCRSPTAAASRWCAAAGSTVAGWGRCRRRSR